MGAIEDLMALAFVKDVTNVVFIGPNGVDLPTLAKNVAQPFAMAGDMLGELAALYVMQRSADA